MWMEKAARHSFERVLCCPFTVSVEVRGCAVAYVPGSPVLWLCVLIGDAGGLFVGALHGSLLGPYWRQNCC